jgi:hypothetical protein
MTEPTRATGNSVSQPASATGGEASATMEPEARFTGSDLAVKAGVDKRPRRLRELVADMNAGNYIALVSLFLAFASLGWQAIDYFRGPQPETMPPESVTFRGDGKRSDTDEAVLSITANNLDYINRAGKTYDAILQRVDVAFETPAKKKCNLSWWWFMKDATRGDKEQAGPIVIQGGGGISKEVRFFPRLKPCVNYGTCPNEEAYVDFLPWSQFAKMAADQKDLPFLDLTFKSIYLVPAGHTETHTCRVTFPDAVRNDFAKYGATLNFKSLPCVAP